MFDVMSRPGKMSGGYEEIIPDHKAPFIFANWNGTAGDVDVLTHECGHAFESYLAARTDLPEELQCPGMESAEIPLDVDGIPQPRPGTTCSLARIRTSMNCSMRRTTLCSCPMAAWSMNSSTSPTSRPDLTPEQRNRVWLDLEKKYRPWNDFGDLPFYSRGAGWQRQLHIYECPFYYIDYCLATVVALQFFTRQPARPCRRLAALSAPDPPGRYGPVYRAVESAGLQVRLRRAA